MEQPTLVRGSFLEKITFWANKTITPNDLQGLKKELIEALKRQQIDTPGAANLEKRAAAASQLITSLASVENGVIRIGDLMVLKITKNGKPDLIVETLSPEITRELDQSPLLLNDPAAVFKFFEERHRPEAIKAVGPPQLESPPLE